MNFRKIHGLGSGKHTKRNTPANRLFKNGSDGQGTIPKLIKERLKNHTEAVVVLGIRGLMNTDQRSGKMHYDADEICNWLVAFVSKDPRENIARGATKSLVQLLGRTHTIGRNKVSETVMANLGGKNARNLRVYLGILSEPKVAQEVKRWAIEKLATYEEGELSGKLDAIEMMLLERMMDPQEDKQIKFIIKQRFGPNRNGRPKIGVIREEQSEEMTVQMDTESNKASEEQSGEQTAQIDIPVRTPRKRQKERSLGPTQDIDAIGLQIFLLEKDTQVEQEMGAKNLVEIAIKSNDAAIIERILDALGNAGDKFFSEYKKVRVKLAQVRMQQQRSRDTPTLPPQKP